MFQHVRESSRTLSGANPPLLVLLLTKDESKIYGMKQGEPREPSDHSKIQFLVNWLKLKCRMVNWEYALGYASTLVGLPLL